MENKEIYNNYLMHHGVKGQKWGVRRRTLRSMRKDRRSISDEKRKELTRKNQNELDRLEAKKAQIQKDWSKEINKDHKLVNGIYRRKGNPWKIGPTNKNAIKYNRAQDKISKIKEDIDIETRTYTSKKLIEKYGQKSFNDLTKSDSRRAGTVLVASLIAAGGIAYISSEKLK